MQRLIPLLLCLLVLATACGAGEKAEGVLEAIGLSENVDVEAPPEAATVDDELARLAADGFNGIVLLDGPTGLRIAPMGSADGPDGPPIDENTVFDIGSVTKQFTAAAIVRLEADGVLSVDDPVGMYLAELDGALGDVTLHELLTHTGGLPDGVGDDYEPIDRATFLERAEASFGTTGAYEYSNVGYSLLGMVIETVSGQSYEAYLREVFFDPLGMDATGYVLPDFDLQVVAAGYADGQRLGVPNELEWADDGPWWNLRANGGLLSSAADMRRWHRALDGDGVLPDDAKTKLFARHVEEGPGAGSYYGYGWVSFPLDDGRWFHGHNGGNGVFFADLLRFDDGSLVFVASNTAGADEDAAFRLAEAGVAGGAAAGCLAPNDPTAFAGADDLPDTDAGTTGRALIEIIEGGDDAARRSFIEAHVSDSLAAGLTVEELSAELAGLQEELDGYTVEMVHLENARRMHVVMASPDRAAVLLSVFIDLDDPASIECLQIEMP